MDFSGDDFVDDAGPDFDPKLAPEPPDLKVIGGPELDDAEQEGWEEKQVREILTTQGSAANFFFRLHPDDDTWKHTAEDLDAIAPPLTRILNRYDATRMLAAAGDEVVLGTALFNYGARNVTKRRRLQRRLADIQVPVSGVPAPEGTGPPAPEPTGDPQVNWGAPPALVPKGV